ncbi:MAG: phage tail protein, partial [Clostridia bacterium]
NPKRTVYYDCSISRPDNEAATKEDKVDLKEQTYSITAIPVAIGERTLDHSTLQKSTKNEAVFGTFFTKVYLPGQTAV